MKVYQTFTESGSTEEGSKAGLSGLGGTFSNEGVHVLGLGLTLKNGVNSKKKYNINSMLANEDKK